MALPAIEVKQRCAGQSFDSLNPGYRVKQVATGPNTGLWYTGSLTTGL
jgi:hypothetical protein